MAMDFVSVIVVSYTPMCDHGNHGNLIIRAQCQFDKAGCHRNHNTRLHTPCDITSLKGSKVIGGVNDKTIVDTEK